MWGKNIGREFLNFKYILSYFSAYSEFIINQCGFFLEWDNVDNVVVTYCMAMNLFSN